ncbi:unnamed protein product [Linum tenue]|uniref:PHD-type zinc finger plants domain-containing protein n=1 Tax=Linum tenue TaxID=586396 RepID=A0AAV0PBS5_9ROSI|nr:unnamed protein product [Linum tenue]
MTTHKAPTPQPSPQSHPNNPAPECCMCGDFGFSYELFQCQVCHFRSQHRYCSNLYPKAESYEACNWCLRRDDSKDKSQNSSNSSSSNRNSASDGDGRRARVSDRAGPVKSQRISIATKGSGRTLQRQSINGPVKKQKSPDRSMATTPRRRLISNGELEKKLRRTKSEVIVKNSNSNNHNNGNGSVGGMRRHVVFRNKVRRYKLLDEVSS